jgi:hypothetical protein
VAFNDGPTWRCDEGFQWDLIIAANKKLKETYLINGVAAANESTSWEDPYFEVINKDSVNKDDIVYEEIAGTATEEPTAPADKDGKGCGSALSGSFAIIAVCSFGAAAVMRKKRDL